MNILDHILAGHYPTDDKGRAMVPMRGGGTASVCSAKGSEAYPIVGVRPCRDVPSGWTADGSWERHQFCTNALDLLPPPPRKVVRWGALSKAGIAALRTYESDGPAQRDLHDRNGGDLVLTKIEYEEPW